MLLGAALHKNHLKSDPRYINATSLGPEQIASYSLEQRATTDYEAMKILNGIKDEYGSGLSTLIRIFNATGERMNLETFMNIEGDPWKYPFDMWIDPGQWSVVLHVHPELNASGSYAGVVYRPIQGHSTIFIGWDNPYQGKNTVWVEVNDTVFPKSADRVKKSVNDAKNKDKQRTEAEDRYYRVVGSIGNGTSPLYDVIVGRTGVLK